MSLFDRQPNASSEPVQFSHRFATIPDGGLLPSDTDATQDVPSLYRSTEETCLPHFRAVLQGLSTPPLTCRQPAASSATTSWALPWKPRAREIGVPCALLWTASACGYMGYRYYGTLIDKGIFLLKGS
jgi:hypothetical protein